MVVPSGIEMTVSLGQSEKLPSPKVVSVVGNSMFSKDLQPAKHQLPSDVIPLDITIFERFAQEPNALFPIVSTLDGKYNSVSFEQLKKPHFFISFKVDGKTTSVSPVLR